MRKWKRARATKLCLVAEPSSLKCGSNGSGNLVIEYENISMVPVSLAILSLTANDPLVARVNSISTFPTQRHIPRRPEKRSSKRPAKGEVTLGGWSPHHRGWTTIRALVNLLDAQGLPLDVAEPEDEVEAVE